MSNLNDTIELTDDENMEDIAETKAYNKTQCRLERSMAFKVDTRKFKNSNSQQQKF